MVIGGLQKLTLIDYPGKVACTLFTFGCNFRCPFCHNSGLVIGENADKIDEEEIFAFLEKRKGVLDGVAITGGEPLLHKDMPEFLRKIKKLGYPVKLDTNGSFPQRLKEVVSENLVDMVAMDIKNSKERYSYTAGTSVDMDAINESVEFLKTNKVFHEFRTTLIKGHHDESSLTSVCEWLKGETNYYLQNFVDSGRLLSKAEGLTETEMKNLLEVVRKHIPSAEIRGL